MNVPGVGATATLQAQADITISRHMQDRLPFAALSGSQLLNGMVRDIQVVGRVVDSFAHLLEPSI